MGDATGGTAQRIDLPIPPAGVAAVTPLDKAELTKLKALEVFGLSSHADFTHAIEDADPLGGGKDLSQGLAGNRQLFPSEPALPHPLGLQDAERDVTVADVEADRQRIEEPTEDDKGVRLRRCLHHRWERLLG